MLSRKRAFSVIISTIILIVISASLSIYIAFWYRGLTNQYLEPEKLEIVRSKCTYSNDVWMITLVVKNEGRSDVIIKKVLINDYEVNIYRCPEPDQGKATTDAPCGLRISNGETSVIHVYIDGPEEESQYLYFSTGTSINLILLSSSGMQYRALIELT